jgi:hypothetical protein
LNCLKKITITIPFPQRVVTLINNKMEEQIQEYLYNQVGKIVAFIGIAVIWMLIKQFKNLFRKLKTIIIAIRLRNSVLSLVIFNNNSLTVIFSDKLGNLTVALGGFAACWCCICWYKE